MIHNCDSACQAQMCATALDIKNIPPCGGRWEVMFGDWWVCFECDRTFRSLLAEGVLYS